MAELQVREKCSECQKPFDENGEWAGLCRACFEVYSERTWWEMVRCLPAQDESPQV